MSDSEAPVEIVPYDPSWPRLFEDERTKLLHTIGAWLVGPVHLVPFGSPQWIAPIAFRDYLRAHPAIAVEYVELKQRLAQEYRFDREAYTEAKGPFVTRITTLALQEPGHTTT